MNLYTTDAALRVQVAVREEAVRITVRARTEESGQQVASGGGPQAVMELAESCQSFRREMQKLVGCSASLEVSNEIYRLQRARRKEFYSPDLAELIRIRDRLNTDLDFACRREEEMLVALYSGSPIESHRLQRELGEAQQQFDELLLTLFMRRFSDSDHASLVVFSEDPDTLLSLASAYYTVASHQARVGVWQFTPSRTGRSANTGPERRCLVTGSEAFSGRPTVQVRLWDAEIGALKPEVVAVPIMKGVIGIALDLTGKAVFPRFGAEQGLHVLQSSKQTTRALVSTAEGALTEYRPPEGIERRGMIGNQTRRRQYRLESGLIEDDLVGLLSVTGRTLPEVLPVCIEKALHLAAREVLS
jgi:hypothetical protein